MEDNEIEGLLLLKLKERLKNAVQVDGLRSMSDTVCQENFSFYMNLKLYNKLSLDR